MSYNQAAMKKYRRSNNAMQCNLTDCEWELIEPLLPERGCRGRPRNGVSLRFFCRFLKETPLG